MGILEQVIISVIIASSLISMAAAIAGTATFYTPPYVPSACYGFQDQGTMIAAANPALFNNRAACGRSLRVRCTRCPNQATNPCRGGEVTVRIVDLCLGCEANQIDLSQEAFSIIANPDAGRICTGYTQV